MRIAILHGSNQGFFPRFYEALHTSILDSGSVVRLFSPNSGVNRMKRLQDQVIWGTRINWHIHNLLFKITGKQDCYSQWSTLNLIRRLKEFNPDVLHLHVINQCQINLPMLVKYVNKHHIPVVWTFHDCRAFTGLCPYFDSVCCQKWQAGCGRCPQLTQYSHSKKDRTHWQWEFRKKWITQIANLYIVTPSLWLSNLVRASFLRRYPCHIIYNGVDTSGFSKMSSCDVRKKYGIGTKHIVLGCAVNWEKRKGMLYFEQIIHRLPDDYQIVLVGGIGGSDKQRLQAEGIIVTGRTKTFDELVAWYQQASVFVNPTLEDNFPTVNIESLASGTPVVTFCTGGSPEAIDEHSGIIVEKGDVDGLVQAIQNIITSPLQYSKSTCINRSQDFTNSNYQEYVKLYVKIK